MRKRVYAICKKSILIILICLFTTCPICTSYYAGASCGMQIVKAEELPQAPGAQSGGATYDNWLEGWGTGTTYEGSTMSFEDYGERNQQDPSSVSDWIAGSIESAFSIIIKGLVVSFATALAEDLGATIDAVVYGRVATGDDVSTYHFGLEDGNVFGVVGAIIYAVIRGFVFALLAIQFLYIIGSYLLKGTGKGRSDLKTSLYDFVFMFVMLYAIPVVVSMILYFRDALLKKVLDVTQTIGGSYNLGLFDMMAVGTAEDFTVAGAIVMACVAAGGIYFAYEYIRMAITQTFLFGAFPMVAFRSFSDKQIFNKWIGQFITNLFVPVIDAVGLMIVLLVQSISGDLMAANGHYRLLVVIAYLSIIPCRNSLLQLFGAPVPNRGFSLMAAAMVASRLLGGIGRKGNTPSKETKTTSSGAAAGNGSVETGSVNPGGGGDTLKSSNTGGSGLQEVGSSPGGQISSGDEQMAAQASMDGGGDVSQPLMAENSAASGLGVTNIENDVITPSDSSYTGMGSEIEMEPGMEEFGGSQIYNHDELREMATLSGNMSSALEFEGYETIQGNDVGLDMPEIKGQEDSSSMASIAGQENAPVISDGSAPILSETNVTADELRNGNEVSNGEQIKRDDISKDKSDDIGDMRVEPVSQPADPRISSWQTEDGCVPALVPPDMEGIGTATRIHPNGVRETLINPQDIDKAGKSVSGTRGVAVKGPDASGGVAGEYGSVIEQKEAWMKPSTAAAPSVNDATAGITAAPLEQAKGVADARGRFEQMRNTPVYNHDEYSGVIARNPSGSWDYKTEFANVSRTLTKVAGTAASVTVGGTAAAMMATSGDPMNAVAIGAMTGMGVNTIKEPIADKVGNTTYKATSLAEKGVKNIGQKKPSAVNKGNSGKQKSAPAGATGTEPKTKLQKQTPVGTKKRESKPTTPEQTREWIENVKTAEKEEVFGKKDK